MYGPGLEPGALKVGQSGQINFKLKDGAGQGPLNVHVKAELAPKPLAVKDTGVGGMVCIFTPRCAGNHIFEFKWGKDHIPGSPVELEVTGTVKQDPTKVQVEGPGLKGGIVGQPLEFLITAADEAGPGPLLVDAAGPSEPDVDVEHVKGGTFKASVTVKINGLYKINVFWGDENWPVPGSPFAVRVTGDNIGDAFVPTGIDQLDNFDPTA